MFLNQFHDILQRKRTKNKQTDEEKSTKHTSDNQRQSSAQLLRPDLSFPRTGPCLVGHSLYACTFPPKGCGDRPGRTAGVHYAGTRWADSRWAPSKPRGKGGGGASCGGVDVWAGAGA